MGGLIWAPFYLEDAKMIPSLSDLSPYLLCELKEHELVSLLKQISGGFTSERERIGEYVNERELVSAYCSYYLPTNIPKLSFLLRQLPESLTERLGKLPFFDIGCGPGTYSIGWLQHFKSTPEIHLVDRSPLMLEQAKTILTGLKLAPKNATYSPGLPPSAGGVMLFGNSVNEMGASSAIEMIKKIKPEFVIMIEPGTKQAFREILSVRESLISEGLTPIYPCASAGTCPLGSIDDWCHQVLRLTHGPEIERLSQLVGLDRKVMPFIAHIYQRGAKAHINKAHFLRFLAESKYSFMWQVCTESSLGELETDKFEILKRDYSKAFIKKLQRASVGESFSFQVLKELETHVRVKLSHFAGEEISNS